MEKCIVKKVVGRASAFRLRCTGATWGSQGAGHAAGATGHRAYCGSSTQSRAAANNKMNPQLDGENNSTPKLSLSTHKLCRNMIFPLSLSTHPQKGGGANTQSIKYHVIFIPQINLLVLQTNPFIPQTNRLILQKNRFIPQTNCLVSQKPLGSTKESLYSTIIPLLSLPILA